MSMLDIAFHIAVLMVVMFGVGLFTFHHSLYDLILGNMKGAIKEKTAKEVLVVAVNNPPPPKLIKRRESDIEKAIKEGMKEPVGLGVAADEK
jgi:hypothetical protein